MARHVLNSVFQDPVLGEDIPYPYGRSNPTHIHFQNTYPESPQKPKKKEENEKTITSHFTDITQESKRGEPEECTSPTKTKAQA